MSPRSMRKWAVGVGVVGVYALAIGLANLATGFSGRTVTVLALIAAVAAVGLALEMWYVSRRIERARKFAKPSS